MSQKPVYIPRNKRNRFHGAFTGGFSAGYYNSVGSKEGWKPMDDSKTQQQTAQDFMDDQDFDEWGGPTSVQKEYATITSSDNLKIPAALEWSVVAEKKNIGLRLLRVLGWREGSTAYVPEGDTDAKVQKALNDVESSILSQKRLRKINLEPKQLRIPPPKLDNSGLGYQVFQNAPEFQAHREKRRLDASLRANSAINGGYATYRVSDLLQNDMQQTRNTHSREPTKQLLAIPAEDTYTSHDTFQDLIGTKSASGFALQDDEDDVYDQNAIVASSRIVDQNQYNTEIYDHDSNSDSGDDDKATAKKVGGILSAWASGTTDTLNRKTTSDGRPPLPGFVVADTISDTEYQRFPGPDLPPMYVPKKHIFPEEDLSIHKSQVHQNFVAPTEVKKDIKKPLQPMAGGTFSSLSTMIKDRFTSGSTDWTETKNSMPNSARDQIPKGYGSMGSDSNYKEWKIEITHLSFIPDLLVCKRLGVTPPSHARTGIQEIRPNMEESKFFEEQVMKRVSEAKSQVSETNKEISTSYNDQDYAIIIRPPDEVYKSIYEPDSLSEEDEAVNSVEAYEANDKIVAYGESFEMSKAQDNPIPRTIPNETHDYKRESSSDTNLDTSSSEDDRYLRKKRDSKLRKRKHKSRKNSRRKSFSNDHRQTSNDATDQQQKEPSKSKKKKKRKKHRYSDSSSLGTTSDSPRSVSSQNRKEGHHRRKRKKSKDSGKRQKNRSK